MPTTKYFLNDEGSSTFQRWTDAYYIPFRMVPSQPLDSVPSGYFEVSEPYDEYQSILFDTKEVKTLETESNNTTSVALRISTNEAIKGSFSHTEDYDFFLLSSQQPSND